MNFFDTLFSWFKNAFETIGHYFVELGKLLVKPLALLFQFLDGVFYFIYCLFDVAVKVIMIFVALFQFIFSLGAGFIRTLGYFLVPSFGGAAHFPSTSQQGFNALLKIVNPTGFNTVVPLILLCLVWFFWIFAMFKVISHGVGSGD